MHDKKREKKLSYPLNLFRALYNFNHKKIKLGNFPIVQSLELTNQCNLYCKFCARNKVRARGLGFMSLKTFHNIVNRDNRKFLRHTQIYLHGESLLHPKINYFVEHLKKHAKTVSLTTNGVLMDYNKAHELLKSGIDRVCFSFEGTNKETYEKLRIGSNYELLILNIWSFIKARNILKSKCSVEIALIDCVETHNEIPKFVNFWKDKIDKIHIIKIHDWALKIVNNVQQIKKKTCFVPWFGFVVYFNGDISPCCIYEGKPDLGNVNEKSIMEIWNSQKYQNFREKILFNKESLPVCRDCHIQTFSDEFLRKVGDPQKLFPFSLLTLKYVYDLTKKTIRKIRK